MSIEPMMESKLKWFLGSLKRKPVRSFIWAFIIWVFNSLLGAFAVVVGSHDLLSPRAADGLLGPYSSSWDWH
jgi:hypothetical protein